MHLKLRRPNWRKRQLQDSSETNFVLDHMGKNIFLVMETNLFCLKKGKKHCWKRWLMGDMWNYLLDSYFQYTVYELSENKINRLQNPHLGTPIWQIFDKASGRQPPRAERGRLLALIEEVMRYVYYYPFTFIELLAVTKQVEFSRCHQRWEYMQLFMYLQQQPLVVPLTNFPTTYFKKKREL